MNSPIKKLLVSINQSNSDDLIHFYYKFFDIVTETNTYPIKSRRLLRQILSFLYFSSFIFRENQDFNGEDNHSQKVVTVEEELDDTDIYEIGNLEDLPRLLFIDEECEYPKLVY